MKPEFNSRRLFGITRSKGKMYELGLPEVSHISIPVNSDPEELFVIAVGNLGDAAAQLSSSENIKASLHATTAEDLSFSASFFDAFLQSRLAESIARDTTLLAASAYYLSGRPGSSLVLARRLTESPADTPVDKLLHWILQSSWASYPENDHPIFGTALGDVAKLLAFHFYDGSNLKALNDALVVLRQRAYEGASPRDLLFIDVISAIVRLRLAASAWTTLPGFTGIPIEQWSPAIRKSHFPKELWPSQILLGEAGVFAGSSAIVQMPTSAGKTRAVEIMLRSGFLSGRTKLAVVVAPFRALCHEIATSLRQAFKGDAVKVNELSDALQIDFLQEIADFFGGEDQTSKSILVLTPEKLLYILRQTPELVTHIGFVVYDEGHQFDSGSRGITYELLLTEIKALLSANAQTVLVSAVIQNAQAIGEWLVGNSVRIVNGTGLLPTARSVAFASWIEKLGQMMFFESDSYGKPDFFVPRVIEQQVLSRRPRERTDRLFPEKDSSNDVALYLGIRLVPQGSVAVFCGRKDTASGIATRAVEIYERGFGIAPPAASANAEELERMAKLIGAHYGAEAIARKAASLGFFVHHGTTPHGLRLCIEHAMQSGRINFVACTSTLAQGVNLPIRYLIVSGFHQGSERIKVRDFQNLIGRAGRSGMHTEGLVIFSDPEVFDKRLQQTESWKFNSATDLLSSALSENTTSSILELLWPFRTIDGKGEIKLATDDLCRLVLAEGDVWQQWANAVVKTNPTFNFDAKALVTDLRRRRHLLSSIESYLMANRGGDSFSDFKLSVESLAASTLAFHLAPADLKTAVTTLFVSIAEYLDAQEPDPAKQSSYSKTLLGVKSAKAVENWVEKNRNFLLTIDSIENWLSKIWDLFADQSDDKFFHAVQPEDLPIQLAMRWISGNPYADLFSHTANVKGTKPWGDKKRRQLTEDDIVDFCESTLGYDCSLILAAAAQFLMKDIDSDDDRSIVLTSFQKSLKYGLPDPLHISCFESGFSDRVVAQHLCSLVRAEDFEGDYFSKALESHRATIEAALKDYPSYFEAVLRSKI